LNQNKTVQQFKNNNTIKMTSKTARQSRQDEQHGFEENSKNKMKKTLIS